MRRKSLFLLTGSLAVLLLLLFSSSSISASPHAACTISRIAFIPSLTNDAEAIFIGHSHLTSVPEKAKDHASTYRLRGMHRNFSLAGYSSTPIKTVPVDAASLTAPPIYHSPDCAYPQHNYLFRLTPF